MDYHRVANEGFKNPADIFDQPSWQEILEEIEVEEFPISVFGEPEKLDHRQQKALQEIKNFLNKISKKWKKEMLVGLEEYSKDYLKIPQVIVDLLKEKKWHLPIFKIYPEGSEVLESLGFEGDLFKDQFVVIFDLPKPLAFFWFKGAWVNGKKSSDSTFVNWGKFYQDLLPIVWQAVDTSEFSGNLEIERVNEYGQHKPGSFYYVWKMKVYDRN